LTGRHPRPPVAPERDKHQSKVRGIKNVFAIEPHNKLAENGDHTRDSRKEKRIRSQQQTKRQPGNQRALGFKARQLP
jgi:hypothetical protein